MATTTNYSWTTPDDTDLVKDGAAAIRTLGTAIDTTVFTNAGAAIAKSLVDAKGDIIAATADNTVDRLAVGANDTVLTADSSTATGLKWATPASGGMTLISTTTLTGSSVTLSSIPQTYKHLQLVSRNYKPSTDNAYSFIRVNGDSNANRYRKKEFGEPNADAITFSATSWDFYNGQDDSTATGLGIMDIYDYTNTTTWKMATNLTVFNYASNTSYLNQWKDQLFYNQTGAITSLEITVNTGTFTSGEVLLYGVA
jgi:hypothetical protein